MSAYDVKDSLHRLEKLFLDSGEARTADEACALLSHYAMQFKVGPEIKTSCVLQAALLTAVNTARRAIHGSVRIVGSIAGPLRVPLSGEWSLEQALEHFGADIGTELPQTPCLLFGSADPPDTSVALQITFDGWTGGVVPADERRRLAERDGMPLAGAIAASVGVSELFQVLRGKNVRAGRRSMGYSVWLPSEPWESASALGPDLEHLPANLWVIGLGHLGQALLWNVGLLPYRDPEALQLVLQDFDRITQANMSTSPLSFEGNRGRMKTRVMAEWAEARGFGVHLVERPFAADFRLNGTDPRLAFCGVDNVEARAALEYPGFEAIVEAGLGTGEEYHGFQLHTFPGPEKAAERWSGVPTVVEPELSEGLSSLADEENLDACGRTELARVQVASSFVGVVTTALAIGQMLRPLHGATMHGAISGTLGTTGPASAVEGQVGLSAVRYGSLAATLAEWTP